MIMGTFGCMAGAEEKSCVAGCEGYCVEWDNSMSLPSVTEGVPNIGVAGAFAGMTGGRLLIAGGANFPDGFPWTGAKKKWHRDLYVYDPVNDKWETYRDFLPFPMAYGISVTLPEGVLMIGGNNSEARLGTVGLLSFRGGKPEFDMTSFPQLPIPVANGAGALVDGKIFIAGGEAGNELVEKASKTFLMLDLSHLDEGWKELPSWQGSDLAFSVAAGSDGKFYLFGGRDFGPGKETVIRTEGYVFDPRCGEWSVLDGDFPVMAGTVCNMDGKIWFFGGVSELLPTDPHHPGFSHELRCYDPVSGNLDVVSVCADDVAVTTTAVKDGNAVYIASGEKRPGVRTPSVLRCRISSM